MNDNKVIGIILSDNSEQGLTHNYFAAILESFRITCEQNGYSLAFLNNDRSREDSQTYLCQMKQNGYSGVLIACIDFSDEIQELLDSDIVVASIDAEYQGAISIKSDNVRGIETLTEYLIDMGHKKLAIILGDDNEVSNIRLNGFLKICKKNGIEVPEEYIRHGKFRNMKKATYNTEKLLNLMDPPTCILYSDDYAAIGGINTLHARAIEIPDDMSITGYDGIDILSQYEPRLTTIKQNTKDIGMIAAQKLIYHIEHPEDTDYNSIVVETTLEKGRTVGKVYG